MNDKTFDALANEHRRRLLVGLLAATPRDDAVHVCTSGETSTASRAGRRDLDHLRVGLSHTHLPKLVDYGFIQWDEEANEVSRGSQFEEIRPVLELVDDHAAEEASELR